MASPFFKQTWTMSAVLINMFGQGMVLGFPSSLLPALNLPESSIRVDLHCASWLGSIGGVAGIPGYVISSVLMTMYGRKITHGVAILPGLIGWLLIYFATDIPMLMMGRFLSSLCSFATLSLGAIVIGEYTSPEYRGVFLYLKNAAVCTGAMFVHIVSYYCHWRTIALMALVPHCLALAIVYTWPESPAWLASRQLYEKSKEAFYWLRGKNELSRREIEDIHRALRAEIMKRKSKSNYGKEIMDFIRKFTQKDFLKPFVIMLLASAVLELSGRHIYPAYALQIMTEITGETSQSYYYTICIDITITTSAIFASILVKLLNRRTLLFSTGFAALVVLLSVCLYLFLAAKDIIPKDKPLVPVSLLLLYFVLANLGCAPIPLALVGEVFPLAHRGVGCAVSGILISVFMLAGLKSTLYLLAGIGVYGFFALYGSIMGIALVILYYIMPETKDKTLQEIENYFNHGKFTFDADGDEEDNIKIIKGKQVAEINTF